jgi:hypothetical protein
MMTRDEINQAIYKDGSVNREHILEFLRTIPTNDTMAIQAEVRTWLQTLHDDPYYSKISFPNENLDGLGVSGNAITRILGDLENYGRVTHETVIDAPPNIVADSTNTED